MRVAKLERAIVIGEAVRVRFREKALHLVGDVNRVSVLGGAALSEAACALRVWGE